ncbi:MAG: hypothetical protein HPPSJP_3740 [Candidatus Hepatoplasma scabrum]|nr:MAG: hypothetical protein HPPSJP_3740 [Candidatus Hepatoplasma sp.]
MKFTLNISITLFKPDTIELRNYFIAFKKINKIIIEKHPNRINDLINFSIISDNPNLEKNQKIVYLIKEFEKIRNFKYFATKERLHKAGIVIKNIDQINAKFTKFCDPDDLVIPENIIKIALELDSLTENCLILHGFIKTNYRQKLVWENIWNLNSWKSFTPFSFNLNTIYPVKLLEKAKKDNWIFKHSIWSDDALALSLNKYKPYYVFLPNFFPYIHIPNNGTSKTKTKHTEKDFYNASIDLIKLLSKEYKYFDHETCTDKPNFFFVKSVYHDLFLYKKNRIIKFFKYLWFILFLNIKLGKKYKWFCKKRWNLFWFEILLLLSFLIKIRIN